MASLSFISFFAGIGGIDLGLERAGHRCVGQVEIDPFCNRVLEKHWPHVPRWGDIRELTGEGLPEADLWTGGFPCQDISNAGKRAGIQGERSGLFFELHRLFRLVRPPRIFLENVAAILAAERGLHAVLGTLAESGYDAEWESLPAAAFGAPHIRDRTFVLAYPAGLLRAPIFGGKQDRTLQGHGLARILADAHSTKGAQWESKPGHPLQELPPAQRSMRSCRAWDEGPFDDGEVDDGLSSPVDALDRYGNAVVPQVAEFIGRCLAEATG